MRGLLTFLALSTSLLCGLAQALEFKSVGANPVILYDAPTLKGGKVYVAPRGMPVELILTYGAWSKVRDMAGDLSWVESKDLVARRNLIVRVSNAKVRAAADETAAMVFSA
ncbi:MAG: SH3 domain-containing protein, partial [Burkholderiales bacterium]|nr:SH3 domain-containing protein [Burkholderiales bacterium]